ncbi:MAG TPA: hypothetical protein VIV84_01650, partial [Burkholderiaceae bacterium]
RTSFTAPRGGAQRPWGGPAGVEMDDLLIRGATLLDGSGAEATRGDLAVQRGLIRAIGPSLDAKRVIDAGGLAQRRVFDLPGGAPRLTTDALGLHSVWVNGAQVAEGAGMIDSAPLAGEPMTRFSA